MTIKRTPFINVSLITLTIALFYVFFLSKTTIFVLPRLQAVDSMVVLKARYSKPLKHLKEIVIIGIDEESYQKVKRPFPLGREVFAAFLENLQQLNPKVVGFDFMFIGKGLNPKADAWFSEALSIKKNVILASMF